MHLICSGGVIRFCKHASLKPSLMFIVVTVSLSTTDAEKTLSLL